MSQETSPQVSQTHVYDTRALGVMVRGEQHIGCLMAAADLIAGVRQRSKTPQGDMVICPVMLAELELAELYARNVVALLASRLHGR